MNTDPKQTSQRPKKRRIAILGCIAVLAAGFAIPGGAGTASAQTVPTSGPVDVARQAGVYEYMRSWSVNVADVNKDGKDDMFVPEHDPESSQRGESIPFPHLWIQDPTGGTFSDKPFPNNTDKHDCAWGDVNGDGLPDMFCAVGLTSASVNELWVQKAGGGFTNKAADWGITANTHGRYRTATFIDANNDGKQDIFVTRYSGSNGDPGNPLPPEPNPFPNELWINNTNADGSGNFVKDTGSGISIPDSAGRFNNQCNQAVDYNGDNKQDLLLCTSSGVHLYQNDTATPGGAPKFTDVANSLGIGGKWNDAEMTDLNNDGSPDLIEVRNDSLRVLAQNSTGFNVVYTTPMTLGLNVAVGDFDGTTTKDIYVVGSCSSTGTGFPPDSPDKLIYNSYTTDAITGATSWSFDTQSIPAITPKGGCGDDVAELDYNGDQRADFFVTNGRRQERGPTQLWTYGVDPASPDTTPPDTTIPYGNIQRMSNVGTNGTVPIDVKWLGTDTSGIASYQLDESTDGGVNYHPVFTGKAINKIYQLAPNSGPYEFKLTATDNANPNNTSQPVYSGVINPDLLQETASNFVYDPSWTNDPLSGSSGGTVEDSSTVGDTMTFTTPPNARWFGLVGSFGSDGGKANITFDGNAVGNIDLYSASQQNRKIIWQRGLRTGTTHTVKLTITGANPSSIGSKITIDGAAVFYGGANLNAGS